MMNKIEKKVQQFNQRYYLKGKSKQQKPQPESDETKKMGTNTCKQR